MRHSPSLYARTAGSLRRMVSCVRVLGIRSGWKYWRIGERARKYPALVAQWADNCRHEADVCDVEELSKALRGWADELDRHYARWSSEQAANDGSSGTAD